MLADRLGTSECTKGSSGDGIFCANTTTLLSALLPWREAGDSLCSSSLYGQPGSVAMIEKMGESAGPKPVSEESMAG
jgi:hypothetical protein